MNVNLFLVHTPFQLFIAQHMVREMKVLEKSANHVLLDMALPHNLSPSVWTGIHQVDPPVGIGFFGENAQRVTQIAKEVVEQKLADGTIDIFLSNLDYPLGNALYRHTLGQERVSFVSYPEGIASVLPSDFGIAKRVKNIVKQTYGWVTGYPYVDYHGDMAGLKQAKRVYTLFPEEVPVDDERIYKIPALPSGGVEEIQNECLVLGQPLGDFLNRSLHEHIVRGMVKRGFELSPRVCYKPHPREGEDLLHLVEALGAESVRDSRIAEQIYAERPVKYVISTFSSALLHLKAMYGDRVTCIAYGARAALRRGPNRAEYTSRLCNLFRTYDIHLEEPR